MIAFALSPCSSVLPSGDEVTASSEGRLHRAYRAVDGNAEEDIRDAEETLGFDFYAIANTYCSHRSLEQLEGEGVEDCRIWRLGPFWDLKPNQLLRDGEAHAGSLLAAIKALVVMEKVARHDRIVELHSHCVTYPRLGVGMGQYDLVETTMRQACGTHKVIRKALRIGMHELNQERLRLQRDADRIYRFMSNQS